MRTSGSSDSSCCCGHALIGAMCRNFAEDSSHVNEDGSPHLLAEASCVREHHSHTRRLRGATATSCATCARHTLAIATNTSDRVRYPASRSAQKCSSWPRHRLESQSQVLASLRQEPRFLLVPGLRVSLSQPHALNLQKIKLTQARELFLTIVNKVNTAVCRLNHHPLVEVSEETPIQILPAAASMRANPTLRESACHAMR